MKEYCKVEDKCRRKELLKNFVGGIDTTVIGDVKHNCCDVCTRMCKCSPTCPVLSCVQQVELECEEEPVRVVAQAERDLLRTRLMEFREAVLQSASEKCGEMPVYVGLEMICGLPPSMVDSVVSNCEFISNSFDVEERCLLWNWASDVYRIIEDVLD